MIRLSYLRKYPGWQDNGQLPKEDYNYDPNLTDESLCILYHDDTVELLSGGFMVSKKDVTPEWSMWIKENKY